MQLNIKLSLVSASLLLGTNILAQDYVRVNVMKYDENDNRVKIIAPAIEINKDIGVDYTLNASFVGDSVSGATPVYSDTTSGASAYHRGNALNINNIKKQNITFNERRMLGTISLVTRLKNRDEITSSFSKSYESDYDSNTLSFDYLHYTNNTKNSSINMGVSYTDNKILIKDCSYNAQCGSADSISGASAKKSSNTISTQIGLTELINKTSLAKVDIFYSKESGYLSNPYYNVVRNLTDVKAEIRPENRTSYGFNVKYIKAFKDNFTSKFKYKYYKDNWDINSHTLAINNYYEYSDDITFGFGYRYYTQSEADFYNSSTQYFTNEQYASHDDRLSSFSANTLKLSLDYKINNKLSYDIGFDYYKQSTGLSATTITSGIKYKF